ncbi:hypothetical protein [Haloquadratum walsbyi]|uniref:hypothetical protein n=1 Tax=Haloquadratum walsbyi TaxID=293091 RepID=UPI000A807FF4|nr:hypothetical protein [Haloquadratum walsbyi]
MWAGRDDNADKNGALNTGKRAFGQVPETAVRGGAGAGLAQPDTQIIVQRDEEPANLSVSVSVDSIPSGGTAQR